MTDKPISIFEGVCLGAIKQLSQSAAPMTELEPLQSLIREGCPAYYSAERRDALLDLGRQAANAQRDHLRQARELTARHAG